MMKRNMFSLLLMFGALMFIVSCGSDDEPVSGPSIDGGTLTAESGRGTTVSLSFTANAAAGIQSVTFSVNGAADQSIAVTAGSNEEMITQAFTIPGEATLGAVFTVVFTVTDQGGETSTINGTITVSKLIDTPATYEFTRDGASTVSYSGQTDRLNQLEEIKAYLKTADGGATISEQVLLDMFANTNDNGGGNFSFTSDRQLKSKTFAPDLDDMLFENLFASAATASASGNMAANGTAGLITREDSGNTILVDENGREYTQFVEKGLMGAVFYNQIFNVYLTDDRTGDDVENTELRTDKNYTDMEHHWDEAFGYFDPPLDFTSPWPDERGNEDRFWSHYSNVVDNVNNGSLGTNALLMNAFTEGRAAIVNNDLVTKNTQRTILYDNLELVAAATAVHYINSTLSFLNEGSRGEVFHVLSEAWAFTNALKYSPNKKITIAQIDQILDTDFGLNGNFWNVTADGLNDAKNTLVSIYSELEPVKDDL